MINEIISTTRRARYHRFKHGDYVDGRFQTGLDLQMKDGSLWFHPFDGSDPRQIHTLATLSRNPPCRPSPDANI